MKLALRQIDWFKQRGFMLGRDKANDTFYIVGTGTGRIDFGSVWQAQFFVENYIKNEVTERKINI